MASARTFLTPEEFERCAGDQKPNLEYWFGEAVPKQMPTLVHGMIQWVLAMMLDRLGWKPATEVRLKISTMAEPVPDLIADSKRLQSPYPTEPFGLCVEIVSPGDDLGHLIRKSAHYLDWKIGTAWIIDPQRKNAFVMTRHSPAPVEVNSGGNLTAVSGDSTLVLPLADLFAEVDQRLAE